MVKKLIREAWILKAVHRACDWIEGLQICLYGHPRGGLLANRSRT